MSVTNQGWYDKNAGRHYPLDELASCRDDAGDTVPTHLLVDARLHFPRSLGEYAFLGGLTLTDKLVSVVILAADDPDDVTTYVPLAALTLPRTAVPGRMYAVTPMAAGVAGWLVFGSALTDELTYRGRFSAPSQSRLLGRACRNYRDAPITSVGKLGNNTALTGLVRLRGGADIEIIGDCREITGFGWNSDSSLCDNPAELRCIVVRLKNDPRESQNLLSKYVGPCGRRPESGTCADPQPVETISGVGPDADGVITIEFRGAASLAEIVEEVVLTDTGEVTSSAEAVGVLIDSPLALVDTCGAANELPRRDGRLPSELDEICEVSSVVLPVDSEPADDGCEPPRRLVAPRFDVDEFLAYRADLQPVQSYFEGSGTPRDFTLTGDWVVGAWDSGHFNPFAREPAIGSNTLATDGHGYAEAIYNVPSIPHYRKFSTVCYLVGNARLIFGLNDDGEYHYCEYFFDGINAAYSGYDPGFFYGYHDAAGNDHVLRHMPITDAPFVAGSLLRLSATIWSDPDVGDESLQRFFAYVTCELLADSTTVNERKTSGGSGSYMTVGIGGELRCLSPDARLAGVATSSTDTVFYEFAVSALEYPGY